MKCKICGKEVESKELYKGDYEQINGAVIGDYIEIKGHEVCCKAVDDLVVIPNRIRAYMMPFMIKLMECKENEI